MNPALPSAQGHSCKEGAGLVPAQTNLQIIECGSPRGHTGGAQAVSHVSLGRANTPAMASGAEQSNLFFSDHTS